MAKAESRTQGGRVDGASATETVDLGSIPPSGQTKDYKKLVFTASLLDVQQSKGTV